MDDMLDYNRYLFFDHSPPSSPSSSTFSFNNADFQTSSSPASSASFDFADSPYSSVWEDSSPRWGEEYLSPPTPITQKPKVVAPSYLFPLRASAVLSTPHHHPAQLSSPLLSLQTANLLPSPTICPSLLTSPAQLPHVAHRQAPPHLKQQSASNDPHPRPLVGFSLVRASNPAYRGVSYSDEKPGNGHECQVSDLERERMRRETAELQDYLRSTAGKSRKRSRSVPHACSDGQGLRDDPTRRGSVPDLRKAGAARGRLGTSNLASTSASTSAPIRKSTKPSSKNKKRSPAFPSQPSLLPPPVVHVSPPRTASSTTRLDLLSKLRIAEAHATKLASHSGRVGEDGSEFEKWENEWKGWGRRQGLLACM